MQNCWTPKSVQNLFNSTPIRQYSSAGVTIKKTNTAMVFGWYNQSAAAGDANTVIEKMGDYLIENGM